MSVIYSIRGHQRRQGADGADDGRARGAERGLCYITVIISHNIIIIITTNIIIIIIMIILFRSDYCCYYQYHY